MVDSPINPFGVAAVRFVTATAGNQQVDVVWTGRNVAGACAAVSVVWRKRFDFGKAKCVAGAVCKMLSSKL